MQFGIRSALAIIAIYAVLFAVMRPFGALGIAVAVLSGTALGFLVVLKEARMARRTPMWLLLSVGALPVLLWGCDRSQAIHWVGRTDLMVEFVINDSGAGKPIPGARVEVRQEKGGFYEDTNARKFVLVADAAGVARKECRNSMCFGSRSNLGVTDTFAAHLPYWRFRVLADGYEPGEWVEMQAVTFLQQFNAQPTSPGKSRVVVPVSLRKRQAKAGKARSTNVRS